MDLKKILGTVATIAGAASNNTKVKPATTTKSKSGKTIKSASSGKTVSPKSNGGLDLAKGIEILQTVSQVIDLKDFKGLGDLSKIKGLDAYLSPEMKSTGEAIGYDDSLNRALYKSLQASGIKVVNYGTIFCTLADKDKEEALPLIRRFYNLGFNIEATHGTAAFLKENGIRTRTLHKLSEGSDDIVNALRQGHVSYVINTIDLNQHSTRLDGYGIRRAAVENNVTIFTALETVRVLLDVLEEITLGISTIDEEYNH